MQAAVKPFVILLIAGVLPFGAASCNKAEEYTKESEPPPAVVVATVGSLKIKKDLLDKELVRYKSRMNIENENPQDDQRLRRMVLFRMINNHLLEAEAKKLGINVTDKELDEEIQMLLGEYDQAKLDMVLAMNEMTLDEWRLSVRKGLTIKKLVVSQIDSKIKVDEAAIKAYYKENGKDFKWPMRVRALQIMVNDETSAEQIRKKILNKGDFAKIAKESSQSPDAASGGDLGFFSAGQMPPEFEETVFKLKVGQVSEVIESIYGFHIFKMVKKEKPRMMTFKEARDKIRNLLMEKKREEEFSNWIARIKEEASISIDEAALRS